MEFERSDGGENFPHPVWNEREALYCIRVTSNKTSWFLRRTYRDFVQFDKQLHRCVFDRRYSHLPELPDETILKEMANQVGWRINNRLEIFKLEISAHPRNVERLYETSE